MSRYSSRSLIGLALTAGIAFVLLGDGSPLAAQAQGPPSTQGAQGAPQQLLSPNQLDDLVAPIALYPDQLLSQILVASTYPLEVVEAQQWRQKNNTLQGSQLMDAARQQNWDPSVQALVAVPDVLARLNEDVGWTTDLGNAFLAQQADVMSAVQRMRTRARANGKLSSTPQQSVTTETQDGQAAIQIQPTDPQVVYVPSYDPSYIWGPPAYGYYPGLYYPSFGFGFGPGIDIGLCFGGWGGWGGYGWGWGPNWFGRSVFVNTAFFGRYGFRGGFGGDFGGGFGGVGLGGRALWAHDPGHRLGIAYPNRQLAGRFGAASMASRANYRSGGQTFGANRNGFQSSRQGGATYSGGRSGVQGGQNYRGNAAQGSFRGSQFQGGQNSRGNAAQGGFRGSQSPGSVQGRQSFQSSPSAGRSFSGGNSARSFGGGSSAPRSFSGGSAPRSFSGGGSAPRSFSSGSAPRSFSGGGSAPRSFGGGGGGGGSSRGFSGGGGGHSSGGGGGHSSGGGGGHRR